MLDAYGNNGQICFSGVLRNGAVTWQRVDNFGCNTAADLASLLGVVSSKKITTGDGAMSGINTNIGIMFVSLKDDPSKKGLILVSRAQNSAAVCTSIGEITVTATNPSGTIALNFGGSYTNTTNYEGVIMYL